MENSPVVDPQSGPETLDFRILFCNLAIMDPLFASPTVYSMSLCLLLLCTRFLLSHAQSTNPLGSPLDYAPLVNVECPAGPLLRNFTTDTQALNEFELAYIQSRDTNVLPTAWRSWLGDGSSIGYNLSDFEGHYPRIGIAACGGGLRASLFDVGVVSGFDARNESSLAAGAGGLLQVTSYFTGLSGT